MAFGPFAHPYLRHLRLPFNLLLAPVFLWGVASAGGVLWAPDPLLGFLSLHLFLYGGTTAFNSYFDRDEGPVGGMLRPPPVDEGLLRFSLLVQALGLVPAALVGPGFLLAWLALFLVFTAYSHPLVRLKARPAGALAAISLGQGALGFLLGWLTVTPVRLPADPDLLLGMLSTALVVTGLYLVTQSYQAAEDRARGDRTLPVLLGASRALLLSLVPLGVGGLLVSLLMADVAGWRPAAALTGFLVLLGAWLLGMALRFDERDVEGNFRRVMAFTTTASLVLSAFLMAAMLQGPHP